MLRETVAYLQAHGECQGPCHTVMGPLTSKATCPQLPLGGFWAGLRSTPLTLPGTRRRSGLGSYPLPRALRLTRPPCFPALTTEGIFRRSANTQVVREVQQKYNMGERSRGCSGPSPCRP